MSPPSLPDPRVATSIKARLLNYAWSQGEDFNRVLDRFALERFLYRWSQTGAREAFALKGASLFLLDGGPAPRPSQDLDFLALGLQPTLDAMEALAREACLIECPGDGAHYLPDSVKAAPIHEHTGHPGIRLRAKGLLGPAVLNVKVDIGHGDALTLPLRVASYPTLLEGLPAPQVLAYPWATAIAEKTEALVALGLANTRMKDIFDLWSLASTHAFEGHEPREAVQATFHARGTALPGPGSLPLAFTEAFTSPFGARQN